MRNFANLAAMTSLAIILATPSFSQDTATPEETTDADIAAPETQAEPAAPTIEAKASTVLATVNGVEITLGHVIMLRSQLPQQYQAAPDEILLEGILEQLIDQTLLEATVTEETLELRIALENERRALRAALAMGDLVGDEPTEEELKEVYDANFGDLPEEKEYNASHILVETEDEAKELVKLLADGADFTELAKEKSTGPSGPDGGDLGWFGMGAMVPEFENAVIEMEVGAISEPVQTQFGWHVLKLNETRIKPAPTMEEVQGQLMQQIQNERIETAITKLREEATIEKNIEGLDPAETRNFELLQEE